MVDANPGRFKFALIVDAERRVAQGAECAQRK